MSYDNDWRNKKKKRESCRKHCIGCLVFTNLNVIE